MKKLIFTVLLLSGCGIEAPEPEIVVETKEPTPEMIERYTPRVKVVDAQVFIIVDQYCIAVDIDAPYPEKFTRIDEFDGYRGRYSSAEIYHCKN